MKNDEIRISDGNGKKIMTVNNTGIIFHEGTIKYDIALNLENEIRLLAEKIKQARESENWGTYKNLILSYKEVIMMYKELNSIDNNSIVPITYNVHIETVKADDVSKVFEKINEGMRKMGR